MKFCSYCGEKLQDDAQVCTACNKTLSPMSAPPINPAPVQQPVQQANPYQAPASHPYQQQTSYQANPYQQQQTSHQSNPYQQQNTAQQQYQAN
ncbi:MAG: zinc-ribbon domain-containing protein, partial [Clostridia bacterium]